MHQRLKKLNPREKIFARFMTAGKAARNTSADSFFPRYGQWRHVWMAAILQFVFFSYLILFAIP